MTGACVIAFVVVGLIAVSVIVAGCASIIADWQAIKDDEDEYRQAAVFLAGKEGTKRDE